MPRVFLRFIQLTLPFSALFPLVSVLATASAVEADFEVSRGGQTRPFGKSAGLELTVGADEYESIELIVHARNDIARLEAAVTAVPPGGVTIGVQNGTSLAREGEQDESAYGIIFSTSSLGEAHMQLAAGQRKSFWLTLDSRQLSPGDHAFQVQFTQNSAAQPMWSLPVELHVLNVRRAAHSDAHLQMYHTLTNIENGPGDLSRHLQLLRSHYVRQIQLYFNYASWADDVVVTRNAQTGELEVDFSGLDARLSAPLNAGLNEVALMGVLYPDSDKRHNWFRSTDAQENAEQRKQTRHKFIGMLVDHLLELGFRGPDNTPGVWHYTLDERPVKVWKDPNVVAQVAWKKSTHPDLKIHMTVAHYRDSVATVMNPSLDVWTPQFRIVQTLLSDIRHGRLTVDASDRFGIYEGGSWRDSPDVMRTRGWFAAFHDVTFFSIFAYHQDGGNRPTWRTWVTGPDGQPVTTGALEALRDGFEDFGYWRTFSRLLEKASALDPSALTTAEQQILTEALEFRSQVFNIDNPAGSLIPMEVVRGAGGGRDWLRIVNDDRWHYRDVRSQLFEQIIALESIL